MADDEVDAHNRKLQVWFEHLRNGQIRLPRFQRFEAWGHSDVSALLETVVRGLPCGATLLLRVGDKEKFVSRNLDTAPPPTEHVTEQLLDGQQRLTALWRSLHDNYDDRTYFLHWIVDEESGELIPEVLARATQIRGGVRYPRWCDDPAQCREKGYYPVGLFNPEREEAIPDWVDSALPDDADARRAEERKLSKIRDAVKNYNIPYLALPATTQSHVALDVFIKMNTSMVKLTPFDIVVAQLEAKTGQSLHDLVDVIRSEVPRAEQYGGLGDLVLSVAALRQDKVPGQVSFIRLDYQRLVDEWAQLVAGIGWMVGLLEEARIYDAARLPSVAVLPILAALREHVPNKPDAAGNGRNLAKAFLWRAFLTGRYDQSAGSRSLQDFRGIRDGMVTGKGAGESNAPIFDLEQTPLPTQDELLAAGWPRRRDTLARGLLAVSLRYGGNDMADGQPISAQNAAGREYHHLFPDSLLDRVGGLDHAARFRALNCMLITASTNRNISNKSPLQYLKERVDKSNLGEDEIRARLRSHLVPFDELATAGPYIGADDGTQLRKDYHAFRKARAQLILPAALALCEGRDPL